MEATSSTPSSPGNADSTFTSVKQEPSSNPGSPLEASSPSSIALRDAELPVRPATQKERPSK